MSLFLNLLQVFLSFCFERDATAACLALWLTAGYPRLYMVKGLNSFFVSRFT